MEIKTPLKNRDGEHVILDKRGHKAILADEHLCSLKFLDNLREHSEGYVATNDA